MNQDVRVYLNNPNLKATGVEINFEPWQVQELVKCYNDPIYFIENYAKIVHIDKGLVPFKLYDYQKEIVRLTMENRYVLLKLPRQSGKCVKKSTRINIRNKNTGEILNIAIGDFHEWQKFRERTEHFLATNSVSAESKKPSSH